MEASSVKAGALTAGSWSIGEVKWFTELDNTVHTIVTDKIDLSMATAYPATEGGPLTYFQTSSF